MIAPKDHIVFTTTTYPCKCGKEVQEITWQDGRYLCNDCKREQKKHLTSK